MTISRGTPWALAVSLFLGAVPGFSQVLPGGIETKRIAIVRDGTSAYFDSIISGFTEELSSLAEGKYNFELLDTYDAKGDPSAVENELLKALADPLVDVVYASGIVVSARAQDLPPDGRPKPIVVGSIEFSNFNNEGVSPGGTSLIPDLTFIIEPRRIPADLAELSRLSGETVLYALVDEAVIDGLREKTGPRVTQLEKQLGVQVRLIPAGKTAAASVARLPKGARAVYVPIVPSLRRGERAKLFELLTKRGCISLSMVGAPDVENGALAGLSPDTSKALHRRTALNIHQILSGIPTSLLPVALRSSDRLHINVKTAMRIGWSPDYDTLLSANVVGENAIKNTAGSLTLENTMAMAASANPDSQAARAAQLQAYWETQSLRTGRRPQLGITGQAARQGVNDRINQSSVANGNSFTFGAELSQLIYSDRIASQIRAQQEVEAASGFDRESTVLDITESAGTAYIDCLLTDALYSVEKENLALVQQNLNLAQTRSDIGAAEPSEVFRWRASLAQGKSRLIQADSDRKNARVALNVLIARPRDTNWDLKDIPVGDDEYYFMDAALSPLLANQRDFENYRRFVQALATKRSPELQAFEKNLSAQGILLAERGRRHLRPEVSASATLQRLAAQSPDNYEAQNEWTIGIGFSIPIFEGGLRRTESSRIRSVLDQLAAQRDKALYFVEQRALSSVYNTAASHPAMRLGRQARAAAQKNYEAVQSKYSLGTATILDLLDAQSELIAQKQAEVSARYRYLQDIISVQRSMAWFEFSKTPEEKSAWSRQLRHFLKTGSLPSDAANS